MRPTFPSQVAASARAAVPDKATAAKLEELRRAVHGIEAMFVKDLLSAMRRGMPAGSLGQKGPGSEIYRDLLDQALADKVGRSGAMGIGKVLYERLSQQILKSQSQPGSTPDPGRNPG